MPQKDPEARRIANAKYYRNRDVEARRAYERAYRQRHLESRRASSRSSMRQRRACMTPEQKQIQSREAKTKRHGYGQAYRLRHRDSIRLRSRTYYATHRAERSMYYHTHFAAISMRMRVYRLQDADIIRAALTRRRARVAAIEVRNLSAAQWQEIQAAYGYRCVYCGSKPQKLTMDHITPIIHGGAHTASNIVPACQSCNSKKNAGPVLKPIQPLLLTVAPHYSSRKAEANEDSLLNP